MLNHSGYVFIFIIKFTLPFEITFICWHMRKNSTDLNTKDFNHRSYNDSQLNLGATIWHTAVLENDVLKILIKVLENYLSKIG